jgi:hypothetical protein
MVWIVLAVLAGAAVFAKLGALSVWVGVLSAALHTALVLLLAIGLYLLWRFLFGRKN